MKKGTASQTRNKIESSQLHLDSESLVVCMESIGVLCINRNNETNHKPLTWVEYVKDNSNQDGVRMYLAARPKYSVYQKQDFDKCSY